MHSDIIPCVLLILFLVKRILSSLQTLTTFDLDYNQINDDETRNIAQSLRYNQVLFFYLHFLFDISSILFLVVNRHSLCCH